MGAQPREQWATKTGFVLAAVGSAIGLGNMWRFSYLTAEHGGAAFILLYAVFLVFIGLPILLAEFALGRSTGQSPISAFGQAGGRRWRPLGVLFVVTGFVILAYYSVIAGWVVRYTGEAVIHGFSGDQGERFGAIATGWPAVAFHLAFMAATILIVAGGVKRGIERAAMVLMPLLFALVAGLAIYASTLEREAVAEAYRFYLQPDFGALLSPDVLAAAAGQAFFSLSLGMGVMITYSSYLSSKNHMPRESMVIAGADASVAFVAGLMVFPFIFAFGLVDQVGESTVGALFIAVPEAFVNMGPAGQVVGALFFAVLLVGALTSAISLLEVVTASAMDTLGWTRRRADCVAGIAIAAVGIPAALSLDVLSLMDDIAEVLLVLGALLISLFVGFRMRGAEAEIRKGAERIRWAPVWGWFLRVVVPPLLAFVLFNLVRQKGWLDAVLGPLEG